MASPPSTIHVGTIAAAVALVAVVVGGLYLAGEWSEPAAGGSTAAGSEPERDGTARNPLPPDVHTLEATWSIATRDARAWRQDAKLVRSYATEVGREGSLDRELSVVQYVFLSPGATAAGPPVMNGYRWLLEHGAYSGAELMQQPAPDLGFAEPSLCPVASVLGPSAPERVALDIRYAASPGSRPAFRAFADRPEKWLLIADPATCKVELSSARETAQEATAAASGSASVKAAGELDARAAAAALDGAVVRATGCSAQHLGVIGSITVTFANDGTVRSVEVEPASLRGESRFECLADRLKRVQVVPWERGDGRVVRRIPF